MILTSWNYGRHVRNELPLIASLYNQCFQNKVMLTPGGAINGINVDLSDIYMCSVENSNKKTPVFTLATTRGFLQYISRFLACLSNLSYKTTKV